VAQANALGDSIESTIWLSHLDPLGSIGINITPEGSSVPVLRRLYQGVTDARPLGVKYGPRPDGLPGRSDLACGRRRRTRHVAHGRGQDQPRHLNRSCRAVTDTVTPAAAATHDGEGCRPWSIAWVEFSPSD
jgi:hypothetical protein